MACNCKANEQILRLHSKYGTPIEVDKKRKAMFKFENLTTSIGVYIVLFILLPFIFLYILFVIFFSKEKGINITKLFRKLGLIHGK